MEHAQLLRPSDAAALRRARRRRQRPADPRGGRPRPGRGALETGARTDAYAWRSLAAAGALLAAGSDAPVESVNPWLGIFAAVHRRLPSDGREDWRPTQALTFPEALSAYTLAPALAIGASDEGHLRVGARADLAVLTASLEALQRADDALATVRSELTIVDGREVHRS